MVECRYGSAGEEVHLTEVIGRKVVNVSDRFMKGVGLGVKNF